MAKTNTTQQHILTVQRRSAQGTSPARRLRQAGLVPGVVYGRTVKPMSVVIKYRELVKLLHATTGEHALVKLHLDDTASSWEQPVLVHAVQQDPVNGQVTHVDFHAVVLTERLRVKVPLVLKGEPVGVKQDGGILEHFLREVEVECLPTQIPPSLEFDISALKIGDTVHVRDLTPPQDAKITSDPAGVITSIQMPKEEKPEEAATVAEPEVIREKKEATEEAAGETAAKGESPVRPGATESRAGEPKKEPKSDK